MISAKKVFFFIVCSITISVKAQNEVKVILPSNSYESLIKLYDANANDTLVAKKIAHVYINKAKKDNDSTKIARGYARLAFVSERSTALKYLDTTIALSINSKHKNFPAVGYLFKSLYLFNNDEYEKSLKNAILGYKSAKKKGNIDQQLTALLQINSINAIWGDYRKALNSELLTLDLLFNNKELEGFTQHYLYSLEGIGKCYVRLNKPDSALIYFNKGIVEALKEKDSITYYAFVSRTGTALYKKRDFKAALDSLIKGDIIRESYNKKYLPYYYYYVGSTHYSQENIDEGIFYYKKIDSIYENSRVLQPELPIVYDRLATYYKSQGDKETQLKYLYKLIQVRKIINTKRIFIKEKTSQDYHIPKLLEEKDLLITELNQKNNKATTITWFILLFLGISIAFIFYYFKRQRLFRRRFEELETQLEHPKKDEETINTIETGIPENIINDILLKLDTFENESSFLSLNLSLNSMSKSFNTNSTYLSKVINLKKNKNFSQYINDLRIDFTIREFKNNFKFRKYTIKAIANESGFKNAESFSKAFYKKFGIYPSFYLKQLENKKD
ncbi:MAG: helix-turn-helix domain-containing protein [Flavobacteriaceae bacterium]|nr:helix-turn-helix domain-containing protein [Flavobacteriaceae bacterium]